MNYEDFCTNINAIEKCDALELPRISRLIELIEAKEYDKAITLFQNIRFRVEGGTLGVH